MKYLSKFRSPKATIVLGLTAVLLLSILGAAFGSSVLQVIQYKPQSMNTGISVASAKSIADRAFKVISPSSTLSDAKLAKVLPHQNDVWQVDYGKDGEVQVDAKTGKLLFIISEKSFMDMANNTNNGTFITEDQAISSANDYASKMSLDIEGILSSANLVHDKGGTTGADVWDLKWHRKSHGYIFKNDFIIAGIDAKTKELLAYNNCFYSNEPSSFSINIKAATAIENAQATADQNGYTLNGKASLMIVNPNYRWTDEAMKEPNPDTRLAWVIPFEKPNGVGEIYIDAENGSLLGGDETK